MPPANISTACNATAIAKPLEGSGWVSQPDGRGTFDILQSCLVTIFLCSWSILFLNVSAEQGGRISSLKNKALWMLFTIFFPEMLTAVAAEQWRSACQSVEDFGRLKSQWESESPLQSEKLSRLKSIPWTMRHAFFADMGGLLLHCSDSAPFPVNSQQVLYLVEKSHLEYPNLKVGVIWDKNKADAFARALTLLQIVWFFIQCVGRCVQHLALSTFELSTLAFIFCSLNTLFFWRHKPLDVGTPIVLPCSITIGEILAKSEGRACQTYSQTPLDFIKPQADPMSLVAPFWFAIRRVFDWRTKPDCALINKFSNIDTVPPRGLKTADVIYGLIFTIIYFSLHLVGWRFNFPSAAERMLWRISSLTLLGLLIVYLLGFAFGTIMAKRLAKVWFNNDKVTTLLGMARLLSRRAALLIHGPVIAVYILARSYVIVEGFLSLRALPATAFASVNWSNFVPHL